MQTLKVNIWPCSTRGLLHTSAITNKASSARAYIPSFSHTQPKSVDDRTKRSWKKNVFGGDREVKPTIAFILKRWMAFIKFHISVIIYSNNARRRKRLTNVQVQDFSVSRDKKPLTSFEYRKISLKCDAIFSDVFELAVKLPRVHFKRPSSTRSLNANRNSLETKGPSEYCIKAHVLSISSNRVN